MSFGCPYLDCCCHCHYHLLLVISKIEMERGKVHSFDTARCYLQLFIAYFTPCIRLKLFQAKPFAFRYFRELFFSSRLSAFMFVTFMLCVHNLRNVTNLENTNSILAHGKFDEIVWHFLQDSSIFYCSLVRLMAADFFIILFLLVFFFGKAIKHLSDTCFNIDKTHQPIWCDVFAALCVPYTVHALNIRNLW